MTCEVDTRYAVVSPYLLGSWVQHCLACGHHAEAVELLSDFSFLMQRLAVLPGETILVIATYTALVGLRGHLVGRRLARHAPR